MNDKSSYDSIVYKKFIVNPDKFLSGLERILELSEEGRR